MTLKTTNIVEDNNKAVFLFTSNKKLETQQLLNIKTTKDYLTASTIVILRTSIFTSIMSLSNR